MGYGQPNGTARSSRSDATWQMLGNASGLELSDVLGSGWT